MESKTSKLELLKSIGSWGQVCERSHARPMSRMGFISNHTIRPMSQSIFKYNPIVAAQACDEFVFTPDFWLGHKLVGDAIACEQFVGATGYIDSEQIVDDMKSNHPPAKPGALNS